MICLKLYDGSSVKFLNNKRQNFKDLSLTHTLYIGLQLLIHITVFQDKGIKMDKSGKGVVMLFHKRSTARSV